MLKIQISTKNWVTMIGRLSTIVARRGFSQSARRAGGHGPPTAKDILPFNPFQNKWMLMVKMGAFIGSGFILPFYTIYSNLKRQSEG
uniref:Uncharacterized protein n=1 Tax=Ciona savignyi TaxID=51511 RepID=H2ZFB7_CIOSA